MTQKLSALTSPAIAGVVRETSVRAAIAEIKNCMYDGATMIDLHMSCLASSDVESLRKIISSSRLPILALNYNNTFTMGKTGLTKEERVDSFLRYDENGRACVTNVSQARKNRPLSDTKKNEKTS